MKIEVMYKRKLREEQSVDFYTGTFLRSSADDMFAKQIPKKYRNHHFGRKRKHTRVCDSSKSKVAPASGHSGRQSKRVLDTAAVLREPLSDDIFDHYFLKIWENSPEEKRNQCTYLSCFCFYMYTIEHNRERVLSWIKKENIFSKKYVLIPVVMGYHWYLLIFCHFGERIHSETRTPCILLLDSLHDLNPMRLEPTIRSLVLDIYKTENRTEDKDLIEQIPLLVPKVPQQRNDKECGIFALYFTSLFLEFAPENFSIARADGYPYSMKEDWFTMEELEGFYKKLESIGLHSSDSEELDNSVSSISEDVASVGPFSNDGPATLIGPNDDSEAQFEERPKP